MIYNKRILIGLYCICLILTITAILGTFRANSGKNVTSVETVLLNPKYASLVDTIEITIHNSNQLLTISKNFQNYIGKIGDLTFPVNATKVAELIRLVSTNTYAEVISSNPLDGQYYNVLPNSIGTISIAFSSANNNDNDVYSELYFGSSDFTGSKRYVRSSKNNTIYAIPDSYYAFLQTSPSAWIDNQLIPQMVKSSLDDSSISAISFETNSEKKTLVAGDKSFDLALDTMLSTQSSNIVSAQQYIHAMQDFKITLTYFNNNEIIINVYISDDSYICIPESNQLLYALDISAYSFNKIQALFN